MTCVSKHTNRLTAVDAIDDFICALLFQPEKFTSYTTRTRLINRLVDVFAASRPFYTEDEAEAAEAAFNRNLDIADGDVDKARKWTAEGCYSDDEWDSYS